MSERVPGKIIYIGSIPYDQAEEQVLDIAKSVGPVVNLKMIFDKETGKSKGYAFVEYPDVETASSAVRNLNNYSIGNRQLKCDFSWENNMSTVGTINTKGRKEENLPPLPAGRYLDSNETYSTAISNSLNQLDDTRRHKIIEDSIRMAKRNPILMEELLSQCPQLSYAIVETLMTTGKTDSSQIEQILLSNVSTTQQDLQAETTESASSISPESTTTYSAEDIAMIKQVIEINDSDLVGLPEDQRDQILQIKQNYRNGVYGAI